MSETSIAITAAQPLGGRTQDVETVEEKGWAKFRYARYSADRPSAHGMRVKEQERAKAGGHFRGIGSPLIKRKEQGMHTPQLTACDVVATAVDADEAERAMLETGMAMGIVATEELPWG